MYLICDRYSLCTITCRYILYGYGLLYCTFRRAMGINYFLLYKNGKKKVNKQFEPKPYCSDICQCCTLSSENEKKIQNAKRDVYKSRFKIFVDPYVS